MVLALALFTNLLFSTAALARASPKDPPAWHQPRAPNPHVIERGKTTTDYWTGAYLDGEFNSLTATVTVPKVQYPKHHSGIYNGSIWVGIIGEGEPCGHTAAQVGLYFEIDPSGQAAWWGWYGWFPVYFHWFTGFSIEEGDTVTLSVIAGTNTGDTIIENNTTSLKVGESLSSSSPLCKKYANWIVEFWMADTVVDFGTVTFSNTVASNPEGKQGPANAAPMPIYVHGGGLVAKVGMTETDVIIAYAWKP